MWRKGTERNGGWRGGRKTVDGRNGERSNEHIIKERETDPQESKICRKDREKKADRKKKNKVEYVNSLLLSR